MSNRNPRLTEKVLRGLVAVQAAVSAGDMLAGDLAESAADVESAFEWIDRTIARRHGRANDDS